jgi:crotonobetainyl-CoA:carnitine CoA-transferase CaiB-like acyl-CoA transferase
MPALDGMRILDLSQYEAGPSATQALAWLGADVVKVERPGVGDPGRGGQFIHDPAYFLNWNANKRSVALDIGLPEGRRLLLEMLPRFDVVVENFGPGVVERLELDYEQVRAVHPPVIYASVKGFGSSGPYADYKCFDSVAMAMAGAFSVTGMPDGPPLPPGPTMGDAGTGMQLALAICAAYIQRLRTGEGQRIELSMQEAMTYYLRTRVSQGGAWGRKPAPRAGTGRGAMLNLYPCAPFGPNDYIYLMAITDGMWRALGPAIGRPELVDDPRFAAHRDRNRNADELRVMIGGWCAGRTKHEAFQTLASAGVPCGAVLDTEELHRDPHLVERGFVTEIDHPDGSRVPLLGWPARLSSSSVPIVAAPALGGHTDEVLTAELGLDDEDLARLRKEGITG